MGQNIHLQSIIRFQTGLKISQNSLLTVIDTTNLYTSPYYAYDYMEIDQNDEERNPGTNSYDQHIPLFEQSFTSNFINPSYIDANNGIDDLKYCGRIRFSCKRISYAIDRGNGSLTNTNYVLILLSDYTSDSNIQINIPTTYWNYITIQSDGYTQDAQLITNPKYLIPTSSQINSLFTITANGHLDLIGLRFSNINPTSLNPLFSIQSPDLDNIPILSIFDCEFNQDPTSYPDNSLSHCLIFINGGKLTISRTIIKDYQLSNGKSSIMIYSDISSTSEVYRMNQIDIINSTFENIKQNEGSRSGSAINAELNSGSIMNISQSCTFTNCISGTTGGAIQIILSGGQVDLNEVIIKGCKARNGGGIYINIDFSDQFEFKINNTVVQECETKADPSSTYPTGYGGGIFLIGSGDYDLSTKGLDLKGMKIYNNSADKGGQSLYVVMTNLIEWCKSGIAGEYVKGNYSDRFSNFEDIEGISVNSTTFDTLSLEQIQQQQSPLQYYWFQISNITKSTATLNILDKNQSLLINLGGYNMIAGQFSVKIVELGQISQMNKLNQIQTQNNNKQSQIKILNKSLNSILTEANTNQPNFNKHQLMNNYDFEIIYPPDDESTIPILVEGDPQSQQTASFKLNNHDWFDYNNKQYGIFISNDRRIFTGIDGKEDQAYPLEVIIEKADIGKTTHFPWWIILIIVLSSLIIIIIILICCIFFCWRKSKQDRNVEINQNSDINQQNSRIEIEMIPREEESTNNLLNNNQQQSSLNKIDQINQNLSNQQQLQPFNQKQPEDFKIKNSVPNNSTNQSSQDKTSKNSCFSLFKTYFSHPQQQIIQQQDQNSSQQFHINQNSSLNTVQIPTNNIQQDFNANLNPYITIPEAFSSSNQPGNNQIIQTLDYQTQLQLQMLATQTNSFKQIKSSKILSPFLVNEQSSQQSDPSLHWQQQIQISDPSKDIDPPLKKNFDLYFEQEQSHNSSNEQQQQQTTIHWNSFKKNDIPSSAGAIQKK